MDIYEAIEIIDTACDHIKMILGERETDPENNLLTEAQVQAILYHIILPEYEALQEEEDAV